MPTTLEQIQEFAMCVSEHSIISYLDIYKYLKEAVNIYNIELPDLDKLDYTDGNLLSKLLHWVEQEKYNKKTEELESTAKLGDYHIYCHPFAPSPDLIKTYSPKEYGQMLQNKHRGKRRNR